ncbi:hypothetical protein MTO96_037725 [Rhipicephalus appendiculatus]
MICVANKTRADEEKGAGLLRCWGEAAHGLIDRLAKRVRPTKASYADIKRAVLKNLRPSPSPSLGIVLHKIQQLNVEDVTSRFSAMFPSDFPGFIAPPVTSNRKMTPNHRCS